MKNSNVPALCPVCNSKLQDINTHNHVSGSKFCPQEARHYSVFFKYRTPSGSFSALHEHMVQEMFKTNIPAVLNIYYSSYPDTPSITANITYGYGSQDIIVIKSELLTEFRPKEYTRFINLILGNVAFL